MKIHHLLDNLDVALTNEEGTFVKRHADVIPLESLQERDRLIAHNLVRKGVYELSKNTHLVKQAHGSSQR